MYPKLPKETLELWSVRYGFPAQYYGMDIDESQEYNNGRVQAMYDTWSRKQGPTNGAHPEPPLPENVSTAA